MGGDCLNYGCVPSKALIAAAQGRADRPHARRASASTATSRRSTSPAVHDHVHGRDRGDRAARIRRALRGPRRHGAARAARASSAPRRGRGGRTCASARGASWSPPARARGAADPGPRPGALSDQRDGVRPDRAAGASDRARRRADRLRAGAGASPARRRGDAARAWARSCPRTIPSWSRWCAGSCVAMASICASTSRSQAVERAGNGVAVIVEQAEADAAASRAAHLLVAAGRRGNVDGLDLEAAGVAYDRQGHQGRRRLRTTNRRIYRDRRRRAAACSSPMSPAITPAS